VVIGSPGLGAFFDESDPGFEKPENRKQMNVLRQGRRDCLYLDAIFKVPGLPLFNSIQFLVWKLMTVCRNFRCEIQRSRSIIFSLGSCIRIVSTIKVSILD